jgi:hypothetical protein
MSKASELIEDMQDESLMMANDAAMAAERAMKKTPSLSIFQAIEDAAEKKRVSVKEVTKQYKKLFPDKAGMLENFDPVAFPSAGAVAQEDAKEGGSFKAKYIDGPPALKGQSVFLGGKQQPIDGAIKKGDQFKVSFATKKGKMGKQVSINSVDRI